MSESVNHPWVDIKGYENLYKINNKGQVLITKTSKIKINSISKRGYWVVNLSKNNKQKICYIHRLIAEHFLDNPENKPFINHINGNKLDVSLSNLEWCTSQENNIHARKTGLHKSDGDIPCVQMKDGAVIQIFKSISEASRITKANRVSISLCCLKRNKYKTSGGFEWNYL